MEIQKLALKNFKSFGVHANNDDNEIRKLDKINMFYGYNNSGKSNLLKFLQLLFQPRVRTETLIVEGKEEKLDLDNTFWTGPVTNSQFIFHKNKREVPIEFEITIQVSHDELKKSGYSHYKEISKSYFADNRDYITLVIQGQIKKVDDFDTAEIGLTKVKLNSKTVFSFDAATKRFQYFQEDVKGKTNVLKTDKTAFENLMGMFNNCTLFLDNNRYLVNETLINQSIELTPLNFKNWIYQLYINPKTNHIFEDLIKFIQKHKVIPQSTDETIFKSVELRSPFNKFSPEFANIDGNIELMFRIGGERLPLSSFGTGIQQILYLLTVLFITDAKIVLIEELELNLSPRYQRAMFKILQALIDDGRIDQIFFTTHSKYFRFREDFSVHEISVDNLGKSKATKITSAARKEFKKFFTEARID